MNRNRNIWVGCQMQLSLIPSFVLNLKAGVQEIISYFSQIVQMGNKCRLSAWENSLMVVEWILQSFSKPEISHSRSNVMCSCQLSCGLLSLLWSTNWWWIGNIVTWTCFKYNAAFAMKLTDFFTNCRTFFGVSQTMATGLLKRALGEPVSSVEIFVSCDKLANKDVTSKSDPCCLLYMNKDSQWFEVNFVNHTLLNGFW